MPSNNSVALSGQFHKIYLNGVDVSQYIDELRVTYQRDKVDITTFNTGGNPVTRNNIRGSQVADMTIKGPYDPAFAKVMELYVGSRTGVQVKVFAGTNTLPAQGDELFSGYYSVFGIDWSYGTAAKSTLSFDMKIPDGAAVPVADYSIL